MQLNTLPEELKKYNQWILYKKNKVPYSPRTGKLAKVDDRRTFASYSLSESVYRKEIENYAGLGFVLTEKDDFIFIDLDHCISFTKSGTLVFENYHAKKIVSLFQGKAYMEYSMSGSGIHIITKGSMPRSVRRDDLGVEIYNSGRYAALTGRIMPASTDILSTCQTSIDCLYKNICPNIPKRQKEKPPQKAKPKQGDKEPFISQNFGRRDAKTKNVEETLAAIQKSSKNEKFRFLHNGQWKELGYPSHSHADMAYIGILAYYSGGNVDVIKKIAYSGKLFLRNKGQREDYMNRTIKKALNNLK